MGKITIKQSEKVQMLMEKEIEISEDELIDIPGHPEYKLTEDGKVVSLKREPPRIVKTRKIDGIYLSKKYISELLEKDKEPIMIDPIVCEYPRGFVNPILIEKINLIVDSSGKVPISNFFKPRVSN